MRNFYPLSLQPQIFAEYASAGVGKRAVAGKHIAINPLQLRDFAIDRHGTVDDRPFGGGVGMVLRVEPIVKAIRSIKEPIKVLCPTPSGKKWTQADAKRFADCHISLLFICGRYRGIDQRVIDNYVDECFSIGDYVISNGDLATLVMIDSILRLVAGVLGNPRSHAEDELDQHRRIYTRPRVYDGYAVPDYLYSGNHKLIRDRDTWKEQDHCG
ncbi:MAG: tRNA (guanosine(37)-N1)-methyltransferase TrmD [Pseudomonadota bacterium]|nr:tRNA (guanosine(37)-N1)-methyltransferase TrmD [Pseudomonadota bacterium]